MRPGADLTDYEKECLVELMKNHIHCQLDTPPDSGIPEDLKDFTYRWYSYLYSNLFEEGKDHISDNTRGVLVRLSRKIHDEHMICWIRDKLLELDPEKIEQLKTHLSRVMDSSATGFHRLRVYLYLQRMLDRDFPYVDSYMIKKAPELLEYAL